MDISVVSVATKCALQKGILVLIRDIWDVHAEARVDSPVGDELTPRTGAPGEVLDGSNEVVRRNRSAIGRRGTKHRLDSGAGVVVAVGLPGDEVGEPAGGRFGGVVTGAGHDGRGLGGRAGRVELRELPRQVIDLVFECHLGVPSGGLLLERRRSMTRPTYGAGRSSPRLRHPWTGRKRAAQPLHRHP
jgi:hypothetical protein